MTIRKSLRIPAISAAIVAISACATNGTDGDLPFEGEASDTGKADQLGLKITRLDADISFERRQDGGKAIITSADSWVEYFGTDAPADVDFASEWVAFYGAGLQSTGGYSATVTGVSSLRDRGGLVLASEFRAPGFDCIVTQALTTPHDIVKFPIPRRVPTWAVSDHADETYRCGPSNEDRLAELAGSLETWESRRDQAANSYTYVRETHSFFANMSFKTEFVVENGVVVERKEMHTSGADIDKVAFHEIGGEVGSNSGVHPVALIDDLYAQCKNEVLTLDEDQHFINLSFESDLLQVCTSFDRNCQDDCSRGPVITEIAF